MALVKWDTANIGPIVVGLCVLCVAYWTLSICRQAFLTDLRHVPGPWYGFWTHYWLKLQVIKGQRAQYLHGLHEKYGEFVRISPEEISVSNLDAFKTIHRAGSGFNKSGWYQKFNPGPPGIFAMSDPKQHSVRRRLFAQSFSNSSIQKFEPIVREKVDMAIAKIKRDGQNGSADILKWFTFMATDVSGELSFGRSFDMLQQEKKSVYIHDLEIALLISGMRVEMGLLFKIARFLPLPSLQHALSIDKRLDSYGHQAILNLKASASSTGNNNSKSIFSKMVDPEKNQELSDEEIEHEASNLIVAGSDTTAISLTYITWALLRPTNRPCKEILLEELSGSPRRPTSSELANLPYMNAVIKEGLRLYGAAPGSLPRTVPKGGAVFGRYAFPEGTTLSTQAYTMHRNPNIFPNPERFEPERWFNPTKQMTDAFSPFGVGARVCLGMHLAILELQQGLHAFFRECPKAEILPSTTDEMMDFANYFLIAPKGGKCEIKLVDTKR